MVVLSHVHVPILVEPKTICKECGVALSVNTIMITRVQSAARARRIVEEIVSTGGYSVLGDNDALTYQKVKGNEIEEVFGKKIKERSYAVYKRVIKEEVKVAI